MPKFTSISQLLCDDFDFLQDALEGTRFKLVKKDSYYYAMTYGETKNRSTLYKEIEGELASLGTYTIQTDVYLEPTYKG